MELPDALGWEDRPELRRPVLVAAFEGWNDAAEAASGAVLWLRTRWSARHVARIDPETYFDFQAVRPHVVLLDGVTREVRWPANDCYAARIEGADRDVLLLSGVEPSYRWRSFCDDVLRIAESTRSEMVVTLGALLADVPHSRPIRITGTAGDEQLARRLGLERSRYEGPTGIVGVLHDACRRRGIPSASLWVSVPHYVANPPNPKATLSLLEAASRLLSVPVETAELRAAAGVWEQRVDQALADDAETAAYVQELERRADQEAEAEAELPTGDELAAELERFLREQRGDGPA